MNATIRIVSVSVSVANVDSMGFAFMCCDLWFHSEAHRAKNEVQLRRRLDSDDTIWFVALAKEQLALMTDDWFHGISFRCGFKSGLHP
jgi:hypothetical protein